MSIKKSPYLNLLQLWGHIDLKFRKFGCWVFVLMILSSLAEFVSIGAIFPFLAAAVDPEKIFKSSKFSLVVNFFDCKSAGELLGVITISFCLITLIAGLIRILLMFLNAKFSYSLGADWGSKMFEKTLQQPYEVHLSRSSSSIISSIIMKTDALIHYGVAPVLIILSSALILISILCVFLFINPLVGVIIVFGFGIVYALIILISRKKLLSNSKVVADNSVASIKILQESLGGIRDILIDGSQRYFYEQFNMADRALRKGQCSSHVISTTPRYGVETVGILALVLTAYYFSSEENKITSMIPLLGVFALGAQKVLPLAQQIFSALSSIKGGSASVEEALNLLNQSSAEYLSPSNLVRLNFEKFIYFDNISFQYQDNVSDVLSNITFKIPKGSKVGVIGATGAGKSTLIDVLMGLLKPTKGQLLIDDVALTNESGRAWMAKIAHVPQSIYLSESTIAENIAFGLPVEDIDIAKLRYASKIAEAEEFIVAMDLGYQAKIGERGIKLSGGQRQRIGLARALYKNADVIVLDEATSALDNATEAKVMQNLNQMKSDLTLIIIAHRLSTLSCCDFIVKMNSGRVEKIGTYQEVVGQAHKQG